jgi:hypothetical protein
MHHWTTLGVGKFPGMLGEMFAVRVEFSKTAFFSGVLQFFFAR